MSNEKVKEIVNLTPHDVVLVLGNGRKLTIQRSGNVLRLPETVKNTADIEYQGEKIPVVDKELGLADASLLPRVDGRIYIVPIVIAQLLNRDDFYVPDDLIRDDKGTVIGARRLARVKRGN